jgi:hypothetical protein
MIIFTRLKRLAGIKWFAGKNNTLPIFTKKRFSPLLKGEEEEEI